MVLLLASWDLSLLLLTSLTGLGWRWRGTTFRELLDSLSLFTAATLFFRCSLMIAAIHASSSQMNSKS
jgi:hypothetical protein